MANQRTTHPNNLSLTNDIISVAGDQQIPLSTDYQFTYEQQTLVDLSNEENIDALINALCSVKPKNCVDSISIAFIKRNKKKIREILCYIGALAKEYGLSSSLPWHNGNVTVTPNQQPVYVPPPMYHPYQPSITNFPYIGDNKTTVGWRKL